MIIAMGFDSQFGSFGESSICLNFLYIWENLLAIYCCHLTSIRAIRIAFDFEFIIRYA